MPKTGLDMTEGEIVSWRKNEGDPVQAGEVLLEIMTDKTSMELEAEASGVLLKITHQAGETVPIAEVIGYIGEAGESLETVRTKDEIVPEKQEGPSTKVLRFLWYTSKAPTTSASSVVALLAT